MYAMHAMPSLRVNSDVQLSRFTANFPVEYAARAVLRNATWLPLPVSLSAAQCLWMRADAKASLWSPFSSRRKQVLPGKASSQWGEENNAIPIEEAFYYIYVEPGLSLTVFAFIGRFLLDIAMMLNKSLQTFPPVFSHYKQQKQLWYALVVA